VALERVAEATEAVGMAAGWAAVREVKATGAAATAAGSAAAARAVARAAAAAAAAKAEEATAAATTEAGWAAVLLACHLQRMETCKVRRRSAAG